MSKLSDFLGAQKIDPRRVLSASKKAEALTEEDRQIRLARHRKRAGKPTDAEKELAEKKPRSGKSVTPPALHRALQGEENVGTDQDAHHPGGQRGTRHEEEGRRRSPRFVLGAIRGEEARGDRNREIPRRRSGMATRRGRHRSSGGGRFVSRGTSSRQPAVRPGGRRTASPGPHVELPTGHHLPHHPRCGRADFTRLPARSIDRRRHE